MNEIDRIMDEDPLNLSSKDLDDIIIQQRRWKAQFDSGVKSSRPKTIIDAPKVNLQSLLKASVEQSGEAPLQVTRRR